MNAFKIIFSFVIIMTFSMAASAQQGTAPVTGAVTGKDSAPTGGGPDKAGTAKPAAGATADEAADEPVATVKSDDTTVECKSGSDVRKLAIVNKGGGCDVEYTKAGETKSIGSAQNTKDFCPNLLEKVKARLETSGFTCG